MPSAPKKQRLDALLVELGHAHTRSKAERMIRAGEVLVNDQLSDKPGTKVSVDSSIRLKSSGSTFVGRGGDKIDLMFDLFSVDLNEKIAIDVGASTGGFTDSMLRRGASKVYAVDVGYNQLDYSLRRDERVVCMEKTNAKDLLPEHFEQLPDVATIDVSFIGLRKVLPPVLKIMAKEFIIIALVKPQFELGPEHVEKGGVVRSREKQLQAVELVAGFGVENSLGIKGFAPSPLRGEKKGNQEYFICFSNAEY